MGRMNNLTVTSLRSGHSKNSPIYLQCTNRGADLLCVDFRLVKNNGQGKTHKYTLQIVLNMYT